MQISLSLQDKVKYRFSFVEMLQIDPLLTYLQEIGPFWSAVQWVICLSA